MTHTKTAIVGLVLALGFALGACGGDDTAVPPGGDGGAESGTGSGSGSSSGSSGSSSGSGSGGDAGNDAGDAGVQDFSVFVKGLIANDTSSSALPVPLPADGTYSDNQSLADYPASFF